ncbi:MAG: FUSC family protein [Acetobacter sp.]|nr:FUSC family protein [Acetobacter sp.]MCH4062403.1 FUSC family protein [Acetobacter sp.]MCH4088750.1 FUSC family protein [Acetobacter sp.]MCI1292655.1 FUSC family protein [Acetobacter sp.]MCI1319245.1 FUSC family protein [Acetobacter sp.]
MQTGFATVQARQWRSCLQLFAGPVPFALRTSCAAIISLLIAMKMELGSPQWAPLTVWVVATASRGETLSKARWRLLGTIVGCCAGVFLIAAFPQETGLFFISLALWMAFCCGFAPFLAGYRSYGFLVAGFTTAIVAVDAIPNPTQAFSIAMARGTYIELGIICEALLTALCSAGHSVRARETLLHRLHATQKTVQQAMAAPFTPERWKTTLADIMATSAQIEYDALEIGPVSGHTADHARAIIAELLIASARFLSGTGNASENMQSIQKHMKEIAEPSYNDRYRFRNRSARQATDGFRNALRIFLGIMLAGLIWVITAWSEGVTFIADTALVYGLLSTREIPASASSDFAKGAFLCAMTAMLYVLLIIPALNTPEMLALCLIPPMIIGGMAARTKRFLNYAFSFNMFLPVLIAPLNQGRLDEVTFFNGTSAFLAAVIFASFMFRVILVFRPDNHLQHTQAWADRKLRELTKSDNHIQLNQWLFLNADSIVRSVRISQSLPDRITMDFFERHMRTMILGVCLIEIRNFEENPEISNYFRQKLRVFFRIWNKNPEHAVPLLPHLERQILRDMPEHVTIANAAKSIERLYS